MSLRRRTARPPPPPLLLLSVFVALGLTESVDGQSGMANVGWPVGGGQIIDITHTTSARSPLEGSSDGLGMWTRVHAKSMERGQDRYQSYCGYTVHGGTHLNMPSHCDKELMTGPWGPGPNAHEAPLELLLGDALVVHVPPTSGNVTADVLRSLAVPLGTVRLLLRTANTDRGLMSQTEFDASHVGLTRSGAEYLVNALPSVRLLGVDYVQAAAAGDVLQASQKLASAGVFTIEGLEMGAAPPGRYMLTCLPLKLKGVEAAPVRCLLSAHGSSGSTGSCAAGGGSCSGAP